jgi:acyl-coenzyme A synthetase/AMP-(fatty) acid ligase
VSYLHTSGTTDADGWFDTGDIGRADGPDPFVENHLAGISGIADHAPWKRRGELVDEEVVLYVVADSLPLEEIKQRVVELPAFMRPAAVVQIAALPRDAAAGKVQRRLLTEQPVLSWSELG